MAEERALIGGGCFWCIEAIYHRVKGVKSAVSGYAGGEGDNPSYKAVCSGTTGHAEVVEIVFDPTEISFSEILDIFWVIHDPTTLNRQGADAGTQYRSVIYYLNDEQKAVAEASIAQAQNDFDSPIVTELSPAATFYAAEAYHQNYYDLNQSQGYCQVVIAPKVQKFMTAFTDKLV
ncbi:MAG: peptide-methionine (S)-S-oxide reductase [Epsilonproteobacteria bacterium]|nr:MAG: peptide-methionine (S)-S-oxide reductase [Campylobacterota bacterium]